MSVPPVQIPQSSKQALQMLADLQLPVPPLPLLMAIAADEGDQFKQAIGEARANPLDQTKFRYLANILAAYSPYTANAIRRIGYEPPAPQLLLPVVRDGGRAFRSAIKAVGEATADAATIGYLKSALAHLDLPEVAPTTARANAQSPPPPQPTALETRRLAEAPHETYSDEHAPAGVSHGNIGANATKPSIESAHLYGGQCAFCFTKDTTQTGAYPTITVDAAKASGVRVYDWKSKCAFQLTVGELPLVYGVFIGLLGELRLVGHGKSNNKSLSIKDQDAGYYLTMQMGKDQSFAIPATAKDTYRIMAMLLEQMKANSPGLTTADIHMLMKRTCAKHVNPPQRAAASQ